MAEFPRPETLDAFRSRIDPSWIQQALDATGTATLRRRRLPAGQVIWLVLGMALFRDRSIVDVADSLDIALPGAKGAPVAKSAVAQARDRLGEEPMERLFDTCATRWSHASAGRHRWRGLALYGADGTTLRVPDSPENREHFGAPRGGRGAEGAYPQLRLVALFALRSHLLVRACFGSYRVGESTYARGLWSALPDHSLCVVDKGFFAAHALLPLARDGTQRHWLTRAKKNAKWRVLDRRGEGDLLVEMTVSGDSRDKDASLPKTWTARAIRYQRPGFQPQWLLTSLLDATAYPAREVAALYHERWEIELAYDEIKTEMLDREESLRSRSPARVGQEVWGILLAYNLVRLEMERAAEEARVEPTRISFIVSLHLICDEWILDAASSPGAIPRHLLKLRANLKRLVLPPRRPERRYPRAVKITGSGYPAKRPSRRTGIVK
ncbi:MAG: IS4 family transposase [Planctomycetota bacterium]